MTRTLAFAAVAVTIAIAGVSAQQAQSPAPRFEVASVKLSDPNTAGPFGQIPSMRPGGGRLTATNMTLRLLIRMSYALQDFQIVGGPAWQTSQKFDIAAKAEDGTSTILLMPMLKTLLADRFTLKAHMETRELPTATLLVARSDGRLGPSLKPTTANCTGTEMQEEQRKRAEALLKGGPGAIAQATPKPGEAIPCGFAPIAGANGTGGAGLRATGQPLTMLVQLLTQAIGKPVHDKTGLTGLYDYDLSFDPEVILRIAAQAGVNVPPDLAAKMPQSDNPALLTALREQLGLRLENTKGPVEVLVIDSVEMPTPD
jgi:uncharacterized protein (TIGR03435 family)